jgi:NAD(P)-dependent dehydrogenase (short-subunit alcohol dehydrogenase family)
MSEIPAISTLFDLTGKVALVTGGSRGIGLHTATAFLLAGASTVIITARKLETSDSSTGERTGINDSLHKLNALPGIKGKAVGIASSAADEKSIQALADRIKSEYGKLDILVANAGAAWGGPFLEVPDWSSQKVLDLNVRGVFLLAQKFTPLLQQSGSAEDPSRIIIVSSVAASTVPHTGDNGTLIYSASKAAATHLGRNLAVELAPRGITVNTVSPGFFPSKLANGLIENSGGLEEANKSNPRGRLGVPEDIAGVMVWLCGKGGSYVNGVQIEVDGGSRWGRSGERKTSSSKL